MWYSYGYGYGWWWWWIAFLIIFFLLPLGYGWGYRGWGPWYRRRPGGRNVPFGDDPNRLAPIDDTSGWGWLGIFLWIILIVAIIWAIGAWGWGTW
jgi:hypothetical protein